MEAVQRDYAERGAQLVVVASREDAQYPEDSFENVIAPANNAVGCNLPYLRDASLQVARSYGATHAPQLFIFGRSRRLRYAGKIDDNWQRSESVTYHYLGGTFDSPLKDEEPAETVTHAIGCTIKWAR